ncbi:hypothetical protein CAEBREN_31521 [Caenorhabditis brenneri]|uniref:Forkhead box protein pes-1 n=1 Tax=Caenorhabditis brenneri TaxID=135651 RepID=G0PH83_CAEBE|nr:hypothetical protein CAEBREN_31521 [Caenorhabditis brenneri]
MTELNSSLCQLNWLIAKGGLGPEPETEMSMVPEIQCPPEIQCLPEIPMIYYGNTPVPNTYQPIAPIPVPTSPCVNISETERLNIVYKLGDTTVTRRKKFDGGDKPPYSYSQLIRFAIEDSTDKRCTLADIYSYITKNFEFYRCNRNSSWKNSIRHNLSLNKQFNRIERADGDRRGWWICVDPPAKKPRILKGEPVRVNPIYEQMYKMRAQDMSMTTPSRGDPLLSEINGEDNELTEQEIKELNLFESYDLNSSFRDVYNQIFEKPSSPNQRQQAARIDWLKISLETAGIDCNSEQELQDVDTEKMKNAAYNQFNGGYDSNVSTPRTESSRHSSSDSSLSNTMLPVMHNDSDDEYDWDRLM